MKYIDEYRNEEIAQKIIREINVISKKQVNLMEVCGTHTVTIFRNGIRNILPGNVNLLSGPGCPVCVTPTRNIDDIIALSREKDFIITTFGDMIRVPGSTSSLEKEKANGADIRIVYSTLDALNIARDNPAKKIVFMGVGFETTSPTIASVILKAKGEKINNFSVLCVAKIMPPAMKSLLDAEEVNIDGFICPGHVSAIIGSEPYCFIANQYKVPCVISGFEPLDILQGIYMLIKQIEEKRAEIEIQYKRVVRPEGNKIALQKLKEVFRIVDSNWRGIGNIENSGLDLKEEFHRFNARKFKVEVEETKEFAGCRCGEVLRGVIIPPECSLFGKICTPEDPKGACMVSSEGTCAAYYKYN
ncbi:MAG: hydrogenase formation protein HypD [Candidatus Caldatribacteriota bacterium]|nr:hydrogenase formation protein HypD [Candidatus Caldatribacteriota bacterium]